jgi:toxin-antitoxin system PIN domain toxin
VKLVDLNVLLYAINRDSAHHAACLRWWEAALNDDEPIGLAWVVLLGFLRVVTHPRLLPRPLSSEAAIERVDTWLAQPPVRVVGETEEHWRVLKELLADAGTIGNLTTDAHLASLAIAYGATLVSCDADFGRFRALRWENPAAASA